MTQFVEKFSVGRMSLKTRLGLGAAILGIAALLTALILWFGMSAVTVRLESALSAEKRMARYATLSQQTATFLVVATEAVQSGLPPETRVARLTPVADQMRSSFASLQDGIEAAVIEAEALGLDQQSRVGTQSLGVARMEAMLNATLAYLASDESNPARLRAQIDSFASGFDPLLSQAVNTEVLFRSEVLSGIETMRARLSNVALVIGCLSVLAVILFQFALVRPQFRRLDQLRAAARQIGEADFTIDLPQSERDEIGQLYTETSRMAAALSERQTQVEAEWSRLNETIDARTAELREANRQLAKIDENRRRFFADVSHELRTPLTVILMEAQIGKRETGNPAFETIEARADRLNRRIDDLLRVARSSSGQLVLEKEEASLLAIAEAAMDETRAELGSAGMTLTWDLGTDCQINCDRNWVRQVVVSLIRNTIRHARSGQAVHVTAGRARDRAEITVTDNGPGILEAEHKRVFERFAKGQGSAAQGFGIGLSLVRWVVEEHNGEVVLVSPVPRSEALGDGKGTKVGLRLPCGKA